MREARALGRESEIEREHEIECAAETIAVDHRDREARQLLDRGESFLSETREFVCVERGEARHLVHIGAGRAREAIDENTSFECVDLHAKLAQRSGREEIDAQRATALRIASTAADVGVPGRKISRMPIAFSFGMSCSGMMPPAKTMTSSAPSSFNIRMISGNSTLCAPERIDNPIASTSS